jgi:hypothetical protein
MHMATIKRHTQFQIRQPIARFMNELTFSYDADAAARIHVTVDFSKNRVDAIIEVVGLRTAGERDQQDKQKASK